MLSHYENRFVASPTVRWARGLSWVAALVLACLAYLKLT